MQQVINPFAPTPHDLAKERRNRLAGHMTNAACWMLLLPVCFVIGYVIWKALPEFSVSYLFDNPSDKGKAGGIWAPLIGTFSLVICSLMVAVPVGVLAGIYLSEYAKENWATRSISMAVTSLAGVPSVVTGLFGLGAFVYGLLPLINTFVPEEHRLRAGLLTAALTIAVMELPLVITSTREALGAVPRSFREACWNLGASRWQTIRTVVLPNSISGILTGVILSVSRAAGETAPILLTGASFTAYVTDKWPGKLFPYELGEEFRALSYHLKIIAGEISGMPDSRKFACAAIMILLIILINSFSIFLRSRLRRGRKW
jgi:phosphate transport system permease protein